MFVKISNRNDLLWLYFQCVTGFKPQYMNKQANPVQIMTVEV